MSKAAQLQEILKDIEDIDFRLTWNKTEEYLNDRHGAAFKFQAGAYAIRMAGIGATSTVGSFSLLDAWKRAAERRIAKEELAA